jgi:hypothetical protein
LAPLTALSEQRRERPFDSQVHFNPDLATETFILDPSDEDTAVTGNGTG